MKIENASSNQAPPKLSRAEKFNERKKVSFCIK